MVNGFSAQISVAQWPALNFQMDQSLHNLVWTLLIVMIVFFVLLSVLVTMMIVSLVHPHYDDGGELEGTQYFPKLPPQLLSWFPPIKIDCALEMGANIPLHITLINWCVLDLFINSFILCNMILCQRLLNDGFFHREVTFCPSLVVRVAGFTTLGLVLIADIFNLAAIFFRNLTMIVFWQIGFMLYFILAYVTLIASFITSLQTLIDHQLKHPGFKAFLMSLIINLHLIIGIYIFYFGIKRSVWTDAYKYILKDEEDVKLNFTRSNSIVHQLHRQNHVTNMPA